MKKFIIIGLLAAIGAVTFVAQANAAGRYCMYNPDDPICQDYYDNGENNGYQPPPYDGYGQDDNGYNPPPRPHDYSNNGYDQGPVLSLHFGSSSRYSCNTLASSLRRSGFHRIRPVDCAGREFAFLATRDGQRLRIVMLSRTGRIKTIRPY